MCEICMCNNCDELFFDTNPQVGAKKFNITGLQTLIDHKCPNCKTDDYLTDNVARGLWDKLGNIPVNEDDEIDEPFLDFPKGTDKFEIWHWFEDTFNLSVAHDLMHLR
jgi:hypothetical protein